MFPAIDYGGKNKDAVYMISELAKIFRISLSNGKTIISIEDELKHCKNYMNIQKYRYKERFVTEYDVSEEIYQFCTVKLIIQPILENAIYYGVGNMDADDNPRILVKGRRTDNDIYLAVSDNGMGMRQEDVKNILSDNKKVPKHGSGVGLINVHTRIQLMFGAKYGLIVESEPDEGTTVTIHLPARCPFRFFHSASNICMCALSRSIISHRSAVALVAKICPRNPLWYKSGSLPEWSI